MPRKAYNEYLRYSTLGIQLVAFVGLLAWGGWWLDGYWGFARPWCTLVGALGGSVGAIVYIVYKLGRPGGQL
jgi:hypothetical protein